ncbi:MAG: potassium channel family protein [Bacteroidota bacterium]
MAKCLLEIFCKKKIRQKVKKVKKQTLTTFIGGVIDKLSYEKIAFCIVCVLLLCSTYFWLLSPYEHGTNKPDLGWFDSLYFCVVTFSSLGYGDILPVGFGKVVASFEVLSGLFLVAVFVGKIASERQYAMLRLVYTSEHQRRLVEFEKEIDDLEERVETALNEHNHEELYALCRSIYRFIASINNYLLFQANQGDLASFGNNSTLRRLYQSLAQIQQTIYDAIRTYGTQPKTKTKFEQIVTRINSIATTMIVFHNQDTKINALLNEIQQTITNLEKWNESITMGTAEFKFRNDVTEFLLLRVKEKIPNPLTRHFHKQIASDLGIQNKLAEKCINILVKDGRINLQTVI